MWSRVTVVTLLWHCGWAKKATTGSISSGGLWRKALLSFGANLISRICAVASKQQFVQLAWTPLSRELPPVVFLIQGELPKVSPSTPLLPSLTSMVKLLTDKARKWSEREKASGDKYIFSTCVKRNTTIRDGYHFDGFTASSKESLRTILRTFGNQNKIDFRSQAQCGWFMPKYWDVTFVQKVKFEHSQEETRDARTARQKALHRPQKLQRQWWLKITIRDLMTSFIMPTNITAGRDPTVRGSICLEQVVAP